VIDQGIESAIDFYVVLPVDNRLDQAVRAIACLASQRYRGSCLSLSMINVLAQLPESLDKYRLKEWIVLLVKPKLLILMKKGYLALDPFPATGPAFAVWLSTP
jgi:hypothetical protein